MADADKDGLDELVEQFAQQYREPVVDFGEQVRTEQGPEAWQRLVTQYQAETGRTLSDGRASGTAQTRFPGLLDLVPDEPQTPDFEAG
jgi:hypothetical protein